MIFIGCFYNIWCQNCQRNEKNNKKTRVLGNATTGKKPNIFRVYVFVCVCVCLCVCACVCEWVQLFSLEHRNSRPSEQISITFFKIELLKLIKSFCVWNFRKRYWRKMWKPIAEKPLLIFSFSSFPFNITYFVSVLSTINRKLYHTEFFIKLLFPVIQKHFCVKCCKKCVFLILFFYFFFIFLTLWMFLLYFGLVPGVVFYFLLILVFVITYC